MTAKSHEPTDEDWLIPQVDADEIVRIIITCNPDADFGVLGALAVREGMPLRQAVDTVRKYIGPVVGRPARCVTHNASRCTRC